MRFGPLALTGDEKESLQQHCRPFLLDAVCYCLDMVGMKLSRQCWRECLNRSDGAYGMVFTDGDVVSGDAHVKHMSIVDFSKGRLLLLKSFLQRQHGDHAAADRLRSLAIEALRAALLSDPMSVTTRMELTWCVC